MMNESWQDDWSRELRAQQQDPREEESLHSLRFDGRVLSAVVGGEVPHRVVIRFHPQGRDQAECDCHCGAGGEPCQHAAVALSAWSAGIMATSRKAGEDESLEEPPDWVERPAVELVNAMSEAAIRRLMIHTLQWNDRLRYRCNRILGHQTQPRDFAELRREIRELIDAVDQGDDYVEERDLDQFTEELSSYLALDLRKLIDEGQTVEAFDFLIWFVRQVAPLESEYHVFDYRGLDEDCRLALEQILRAADGLTREEIFHWLTGHLFRYDGDLGSFIHAAWKDHFQEPVFLQIKQQVMAKRLKSLTGDR